MSSAKDMHIHTYVCLCMDDDKPFNVKAVSIPSDASSLQIGLNFIYHLC